ncbi:MAG: hypothetical protein N2749_02460 [Clostridia bacterium]|nr:hypothetical protein [Clostridia bacterium]
MNKNLKLVESISKIVIILAIIGIIGVIIYNKNYFMLKESNEYIDFSKYENEDGTINLNQELKSKLTDYYVFTKNISLLNFNRQDNIDTQYYNLVVNLIYNLSNSKKLTYIDGENSDLPKLYNGYINYYMTKKNFYTAFNELYNLNVDYIDISTVEGLNNFIYYDKNKQIYYFCTDQIYVRDTVDIYGVESIKKQNDRYLCTMYKYSYYENDEDKSNAMYSEITENIKQGNYNYINTTLNDKYVININKVEMDFNQNPRGKIFKYTIYNIATQII